MKSLYLIATRFPSSWIVALAVLAGQPDPLMVAIFTEMIFCSVAPVAGVDTPEARSGRAQTAPRAILRFMRFLAISPGCHDFYLSKISILNTPYIGHMRQQLLLFLKESSPRAFFPPRKRHFLPQICLLPNIAPEENPPLEWIAINAPKSSFFSFSRRGHISPAALS